MRRSAVLAAAAALMLGVVVPVPSAVAAPATSIAYPKGSGATRYTGLAFDTCTAPSRAALAAWKASPYDAVAVYIGGRERSCAQPELTPQWVADVTATGWRLIPVFLDRQASCTYREDSLKISNALAADQGNTAAREAVSAAKALGMRPGSALYYDMEHYNPAIGTCRTGVLTFLSAWTKELHRQGYVSGAYVHQNSGALHLAQTYSSTTYARPDAVWIARWDGNSSLTGWPTVPDNYWTRHQRAKQYQGDHNETWPEKGVTLNIDSDRFDAPVATVPQPYRVTSAAPLNGRSGPATSYPVVRTYARGTTVRVLCQTLSQPVGATAVWDRLADGNWVTDRYVSTPSATSFSAPLPRCQYPFQTTAVDGLNTRSGPSASYPRTGTITYGSFAWLTCQRLGSLVGTTRVWDRIDTGRYVTDYYVANASNTSWTSSVPRCWTG